MRPVEKKYCELYQLKDGTYTIDDLADFHEMIDEVEEYQRRHQAAAEEKG